ncbi:MAG TPA: glycoside hydrolase family 15 protein [Streptosporangiaceae bacterium]|nr:glycoside hydrolase family 15 protein [Streptosporangiaceae bacterium]
MAGTRRAGSGLPSASGQRGRRPAAAATVTDVLAAALPGRIPGGRGPAPAQESAAQPPPRLPYRTPPPVFPPIADYAFLSDCEVTALVAPSGAVEWLCLPRMDSPSVFGAILDRGAGAMRIGPAEMSVPDSRRYLPGTLVLETTWNVGEGWVVVCDALLIGPWRTEDPARTPYRRPPTDYAAQHILIRTVRCVKAEVQMLLSCDPAFGYGLMPAKWRYTGHGYHQGAAAVEGPHPPLVLTTDMRLGFEGPRAVARTLLQEGDQRFCALSWGDADPPTTLADASARLTWTCHHWQHWLAAARIPDHPWRTHLARSALTLKGLTYAPTGAIAAAATTSLPETPGGQRNYDYRHSWIRDSTFALWGLYTLGFDWEANDFYQFVTDMAERDGELQIVYGVGGEADLTERELPGLHGYEGARPVRVGNDAFRQRQNDVWGAVLDSVYLHTKSRDRVDDRVWPVLCQQVERALAAWREPDHGIWEVRGEPKHFTSSKVMCWVAADRGARLARVREEWDVAARWQLAAEEIHADVCARAVRGRGVFTQHYETDALDASMLLIPLFRFLLPDDPRVRATVLAIEDELTTEGLVLRYRVDETDDGFSGEEGTFTICSFWLVSALTEIGEHRRARQLCEKLLGLASPLLLYAEELDPYTGRHLGNFPQAFTHLALINAVMHIIRAEGDGARHARRPRRSEAAAGPLRT